jgi:hypothetical protein
MYIDNVSVNSSNGWYPTSHLSGGYIGEITYSTTGVKTITGLSITIQPGFYLLALQTNNFIISGGTSTNTLHSLLTRPTKGSPFIINPSTTGPGSYFDLSTIWERSSVTYVSGTPAAVANWNPKYYSDNGILYGHSNPILLRWS